MTQMTEKKKPLIILTGPTAEIHIVELSRTLSIISATESAFTASIFFSASSSSSPSQISSISSPLLTQAPSTLNTLFALEVPPSKENVIFALTAFAVLHNSPAGRRWQSGRILYCNFFTYHLKIPLLHLFFLA